MKKIVPSKMTSYILKQNPILKTKDISICVVGSFNNKYSTNVSLADHLEQLEEISSVIRYDYREALKTKYNKVIGEMVDISKIVDLMIICKGNGIPVHSAELCSKYCKLFFWMMDIFTHFNAHKNMLNLTKYCSYRSATGYGTSLVWSSKIKLPVYHVLDGADLRLYYPLENKKIYDVTFIGAKDVERSIIMDFLRKNDITVKFFGPGYNEYIKPPEFRKICSESKIVLNISRGNYAGYSSLRLWNLLACGSMVLTKKIPKMEELMGLKEGYNIVSFNNLIELKNVVNYYLNHPDKRIEIGLNGLEFVKNNRSWLNVSKDILKITTTEEGVLEQKQLSVKELKMKQISKKRKVKDGWITY